MEVDTVTGKNWILFQFFKKSKGCQFTLEGFQDRKTWKVPRIFRNFEKRLRKAQFFRFSAACLTKKCNKNIAKDFWK